MQTLQPSREIKEILNFLRMGLLKLTYSLFRHIVQSPKNSMTPKRVWTSNHHLHLIGPKRVQERIKYTYSPLIIEASCRKAVLTTRIGHQSSMDRLVERWFLDSIEHLSTLFCALCLIPSRITRSWVSSCSLLTSHQVVLLNPFLFTRLEWSVQRRSHHTVNVRAPEIIFINENWKDRRNKVPHKFSVKHISVRSP